MSPGIDRVDHVEFGPVTLGDCDGLVHRGSGRLAPVGRDEDTPEHGPEFVATHDRDTPGRGRAPAGAGRVGFPGHRQKYPAFDLEPVTPRLDHVESVSIAGMTESDSKARFRSDGYSILPLADGNGANAVPPRNPLRHRPRGASGQPPTSNPVGMSVGLPGFSLPVRTPHDPRIRSRGVLRRYPDEESEGPVHRTLTPCWMTVTPSHRRRLRLWSDRSVPP